MPVEHGARPDRIENRPALTGAHRSRIMRGMWSRRLVWVPTSLSVLALAALAPGCGGADEAAAPAATPVKIVGRNGAVYPADASGRAMVLWGWELSRDRCDSDPFADAATVLPEMASFGYGAVRVPINWECIEPTYGHVDEAYLASYDRVFRAAESVGMLVTPDLNAHFPAWVLAKTGRAQTSDPLLGSHGDEQFVGAYGLVYDDPEVHDHLLGIWTLLVERWHAEPSLFGWDLWNEPWWDPVPSGTALGDFDAAMAAERTKLTPFYQAVTDTIRAVDREHWILLEPFWAGTSSFLRPTQLGAISDPVGKVAYAPHVYNLPMEIGADYDPSTRFVERYWGEVVAYPDAQGLPILVWEWGPREPTTAHAVDYVQGVLDGIDAHAAGSMGFVWCKGLGGWCGLDANGAPGGAMKRLVAAYAPRIAGTPVRMSHRDGVFHLEWEPTPGGTTEVVVPNAAYPTGHVDTLVGATSKTVAGAGIETLRIVADEGASLVTLDVAAK